MQWQHAGIALARQHWLQPRRPPGCLPPPHLLVAMIIFTLPTTSKPSSWLSSSISVRWISRSALVPARRPIHGQYAAIPGAAMISSAQQSPAYNDCD
jgi:hypothetical protein